MFKIFLFSTFVLAVSAVYEYACPSEGQHFYRYPYDCSKFIECKNGQAVVEDCIPGLFFEENIGYCDFPDNVNCVVEVEVTPSGPDGKCPETNGEYAVFLADTQDCTKYYECDWGTAYQMECPEGLYFNHVLDVCDYPIDSGCVHKL